MACRDLIANLKRILVVSIATEGTIEFVNIRERVFDLLHHGNEKKTNVCYFAVGPQLPVNLVNSSTNKCGYFLFSEWFPCGLLHYWKIEQQ